MEDDGAVSSPEDSGVLDAEAAPAEDSNDTTEHVEDSNDVTAEDGDEGAAGRERVRKGQEEEEEKEGVLKDPPYEYPTGLVEVDDE